MVAPFIALLAAFLVLIGVGPVHAQGTFHRSFDCPRCPRMIDVPPGEFVMGTPPGEEESENVPQQYRGFSTPQKRITIPFSFALSEYPVTRAEYAGFVRATNRPTGPSCWHLTIQPGGGGKFEERQGLNWRNPGFDQDDSHPVVCVSWDDATAYAAWLARVTGKPYRLPTEAEWEYAARAGTTGPRYWSGGKDQACRHENVRDETLAGQFNFNKDETYFPCADGFVFTSPAGYYLPNPFGFYDMLGNVGTWTQDCWNATLEGITIYGSARLKGDCSLRVVRGGSWVGNAGSVRAGYRYGGSTGYRSAVVGFRVARTN